MSPPAPAPARASAEADSQTSAATSVPVNAPTLQGSSELGEAQIRPSKPLPSESSAEDPNPETDPPPGLRHYGPELRGRSKVRSEVTEQLYARSVGELYRRSEKHRSTDSQQPVVVSPGEVTEDLIESIPVRTKASWTLYRSALLWHLAANRDRNEAYASAYKRLATTPLSAADGSSRPPTRPKKTIPHEDLILLLTELSGMNRTVNWGYRTGYWLLAALASGARPREWIAARWLDDGQEVLRIQNGKQTRAAVPAYLTVPRGKTIFDVEAEHPELLSSVAEPGKASQFRDVPIDKDDRLWVDQHIRALEGYLKDPAAAEQDPVLRYEAYYHYCRRALHVACKRAFKGKRSYSLYVMRSQFSANAKARVPIEEVAALMGHSSTRATMGSYGPRRAAHGGMTPRQAEGTVEHAGAEPHATQKDRPDADRE